MHLNYLKKVQSFLKLVGSYIEIHIENDNTFTLFVQLGSIKLKEPHWCDVTVGLHVRM